MSYDKIFKKKNETKMNMKNPSKLIMMIAVVITVMKESLGVGNF